MKRGLIIIARRKLELPEERFNKRKVLWLFFTSCSFMIK
jgi:hypothetical protein